MGKSFTRIKEKELSPTTKGKGRARVVLRKRKIFEKYILKKRATRSVKERSTADGH